MMSYFTENSLKHSKNLLNMNALLFKPFLSLFVHDNPTRKFLTKRIAAFFKFGPIKLIYSEKTPSRVKKQPAE
jgi:hypothetical protein